MGIDFRSKPEFLRGRTAERVVASWLQQRGWYVIPSYDYSGEDGNKAPKMQGLSDAFVLPDLDVMKHGTRRWAEVKAKRSASYTYKTGRYEHGIPLRHYHEYQRVQMETGSHVYLFVLEEDKQVVIAESLDRLSLSVRIYNPDRETAAWEWDTRLRSSSHRLRMMSSGMAFFPRDAFTFVSFAVADIAMDDKVAG